MSQYDDPQTLLRNAQEKQQQYEREARQARDYQAQQEAQRKAAEWQHEAEKYQTYINNKRAW